MDYSNQEWAKSKLGNISTYVKGYAFKSKDYSSKGKRVIRVSDTNFDSIKDESPIFVEDNNNRYSQWELKTGDLVFTTVGSKPPAYNSMVGKALRVSAKHEGALLNQNAVIIRMNADEYNQDYIYYHFKTKKYLNYIETIIRGNANQVSITLKELFDFKIPLPVKREQDKIAQLLSTWDQAIEKTQKLIDQLKLRKKGLIQELLYGKKRLPGFDGEWKKYEIAEIASQFTDKNSDNKISEVLSCTKYDGLVRSLEYFGRKVYGDDLSKYKVVPRNYFAYATNHIEEGSIGYQDLMDAGLVSPMYTVFKTNSKVDDSYLFRLLKTDRMIYHYQSNMSGSVARRGGLRWNTFKELIVKLPGIDEQKAITSLLDEADNELNLQSEHLDSLKSQKKGLMQQLLTGKKRVKI